MYPPPRLLFVGSFRHPPNIDGALTLCREIMPRVWSQRPDVVLDIVGADPPETLRRAAQDPSGRIHLLGFVDDLEEHFEASWIFVAPLFSGGGIKIKVLEAMARGSAIVTTPIGAEGIDDEGHCMAIAKDVESFAQSILQVIANPARRLELATEARQRAQTHFDWNSIVGRLTDLAVSARQGVGRP